MKKTAKRPGDRFCSQKLVRGKDQQVEDKNIHIYIIYIK